MGDMIELKLEDSPEKVSDVLVEAKIDGARHTWDGKNIISDRGIVRNDRFPHIVDELKRIPFVGRGEVAIPFGNVLLLNKKENWSKARFYMFDVYNWQGQNVRDSDAASNRHILETMAKTLGFGKNFFHLRIPFKFSDFQTGWAYVLKHSLEGLVLKELNGFRQFKVKYMKEIKVPIIGLEPGKAKGAFQILVNGTVGRCSALSVGHIQLYKDILAKGLPPYAEIEYLFMTDNGIPFQPRLRRIGTQQDLVTT